MTNFKRTTATTQNETRENIMIRYNNDIVIPERTTTLHVIPDGRQADPESNPGCPSQSPMGWKRPGFRTIAKAISGMTFAAALLLAPNAALAQNECGGDPVLDIGDDTYNCPDASYPDGVTYDADGNLTVNFTNGSVTEVESGGIDLTATGTDGITFDSQSTTTEIESRAVTGALLDVRTVDGGINIDTEEMDADGQTADNVTHAIYAESTGSGSIDITTTGNVEADAAANPDGAAGIEAITGSGDLTITASGTVAGKNAGIVATTGTGQLTVNVNSGGVLRTQQSGGTALDLTAAGQATLNNSGTIGDPNRSSSSIKIRASGGSIVLNNNGGGILSGAMDLSGLSGGYVFNNNPDATWTTASRQEFFNASGPQHTQTSHLGAGTLNNAGTIALGVTDSVIAPGTDYVGNDGVLEFEVAPGLTGQTDCTSPTVSGCLYIPGGSTSGTTRVRAVFLAVPNSQESPAAANTGIVLVDVNGGSSQAEHFVLDPGSIQVIAGRTVGSVTTTSIYAEDPIYGAVLDLGGVLDHTLLYNPDNQQHVLAPVPKREGVEYVSFIHEALSIWHTTADAVAGRQSALRNGADRGMWFRIAGEQTERESSPTLSTHGNDFTYGQEYSLWTGAAIAGFDITASDEHVLGFHIGYVTSRANYEGDSDTVDDTTGTTIGAYGGWWRNGLTFDGTINANLLELDHRFGSNPKDLEESDSTIQTLGARLEMGYQAPILGERLYLQPLAAVSYASADIKELELRDNDLSFEDAKSLRIGIGMRVGGDLATAEDAGKLGYWLTARRWEEREGSGRVLFEVRDGADLAVEDDLSGAFNEIDLGVNWGNAEGDLSGYVSGGAKFDKDDNNDSYNFSVGIRKNW